jgi:hypothetical protein|tara:strand:- start:1291 stop:1530 length:240 start_codon:yes stop_codon:yes gene_type:complete
MKIDQQKTTILDPKQIEEGFMVGKYEDPLCYAAVPVAGSVTQLAIIHQGSIIKYCRNRQSALNFIERHKKKKSVARLPV